LSHQPRIVTIVTGCLSAVEAALKDGRRELTYNEATMILDRLCALTELVNPELLAARHDGDAPTH
jgi:hypothetical protein